MTAATLILASLLTAPPRVQVVVFSAPAWCVPCRVAESDFKPWLERSGWKVDSTEEAHVRLIDVDCERELADEYGIENYPTFIVQRDGKEVRRYVGYRGRKALVEDYMREWRK